MRGYADKESPCPVVFRHGCLVQLSVPSSPITVWSSILRTWYIMLRASNIFFSYDTIPILRDVTLTASPGQRIGILGPNGAGKTTLLRVLAGLVIPNRGSVELDTTDLKDLKRASIAKQLAMVPQETSIEFDYSVLEVALMGRHPHLGALATEGPDDINLAISALKLTATDHLSDRSFNTLSGGEKQRVIVASALTQLASPAVPTNKSSVLLLDEPTASLDLNSQAELLALLRTLQAQQNRTLIVSTHDLNFAIGICDYLVLLLEGTVMACGPIDSVLTTANMRSLYDADIEIVHHQGTEKLVALLADHRIPHSNGQER